MEDLQKIASNLTLNDEGLWVALENRNVSYPEEGNEACFEIEENSFWFQHRNEIICKIVNDFGNGDVVFDIGGGNGFVALALQKSGVETVVVEPGPTGARHAKERGLNSVVQSTLEDAGFAKNSIPAMGLFDVLEHIEDDDKFLQSIHDYLKPEGRLFLTVPALSFLWSIDDVHAGHFRRYTTGSLASRLETNGFRVDYCSYFFWFLTPAVFVLRSIPSRLGLRKAVSTATATREHAPPSGLAGLILQTMRSVETKRIGQHRRMPIGTSCIAVARKPA